MFGFVHPSTILVQRMCCIHTTIAYTHNRTCDRLIKLDKNNFGSPVVVLRQIFYNNVLSIILSFANQFVHVEVSNSINGKD